ncbi:MAG TPA: DUF433 domain-containing protein [Gemmataceae bacterium]|jgi:uncharacterized protein (DUF433 family)|nr:DUF433 domain-containing protein [Gemmataceae bacterium]
MITSFRTSVHGRTIELPWDLGLPDGHVIEVTIKTCPDAESLHEPPRPRWLERLEVNVAVVPGKLVIKGTRLRADALVELVEEGKSDEDLLRAHPELTPDDVAAVREYAKAPLGLRRSFGAWADDAEELDKFLEEIRRARKIPRRGIEE